MGVRLTFFIESDTYFDVEGLSSPFTVYIPLGVTNNLGTAKYIKVELVTPPSGWGSYSQQLGSVAAGSSAFKIFTPTRTTPTLSGGELDESLTLRVSAYEDSGYTTLYGYADLTFTVHFFDSTDATWTIIDIDNFDAGDAEGWAGVGSTTIDYLYNNYWATPGPSSTHYITSPYAITATTGSNNNCVRKSFTVGAYTKARFVLHYYRNSGYNFAAKVGDNLVLPFAVADAMPAGAWIRFAGNFPVGASTYIYMTCTGVGNVWVDKIKVIAK
jgi:hypothetical protein